MNMFERMFGRKAALDDSAEWRAIWTKYASHIAPNPELARTKQELIVTCAGVIDKIWNVNGGAYWDEGSESDYIDPLRKHLCVDTTFSQTERAEIEKCLNQIAVIGRKNVLLESSGEEDVGLESDHGAAAKLVKFVVRWCRNHPDSIMMGPDEDYHGHD